MVNNKTTLDYNLPVSEWIEGLPIGNGTIGAMIYGLPGNETLSLNHDKLWRNKIDKRVKISRLIPILRDMCLEGNSKDAEKLLFDETREGPDDINSYQPFCNFHVCMGNIVSYEKYLRKLDLEKAMAYIEYISYDTRYSYECFADEDTGLLYVKITSDKPGKLNCSLGLSRVDDPECAVKTYCENGLLIFEGEFIENVAFAAIADIKINSGEKHVQDNIVNVNGADQVIMKLALSTSYNSDNPLNDCLNKLANSKDGYEYAKKAHIEKQSRLFNRSAFSLIDDNINISTEKLFDKIIQTQEIDATVYEQIFSAAKYILLSASRPGSMPINLQGIWNDSINPAWDCSYTTDINIQMHYWLSLPINLSDCHKPVFDWIFENIEVLKNHARDIFGCSGIFIPQYTDFKFIPTKGVFGAFQLIWSGAAAWLGQHFYDYWKYTGDEEFLFDYAYPYLKECADFYKGFLVKDENGKYISCLLLLPQDVPQ